MKINTTEKGRIFFFSDQKNERKDDIKKIESFLKENFENLKISQIKVEEKKHILLFLEKHVKNASSIELPIFFFNSSFLGVKINIKNIFFNSI